MKDGQYPIEAFDTPRVPGYRAGQEDHGFR